MFGMGILFCAGVVLALISRWCWALYGDNKEAGWFIIAAAIDIISIIMIVASLSKYYQVTII